MSKRLVFKKTCLPILIICILIVDLILSPILILLADQNHYIASKSTCSYDELFSSNNNSFNSKDYIGFYNYIDLDGINAKEILDTAQFKRVSPYKYGIIMLLYRPERKIGDLSLVMPLSDISDNFSDDIIKLSKESGFCSSGMLFFYRDRLYLLSHIKGNNFVKHEDWSSIKNAIEAFQTSENTDICLFEVENANPDFINKVIGEEYFSIKNYPTVLQNLQISFAYKLLAFVIFILQYIIVFAFLYLFKRKRNKKK